MATVTEEALAKGNVFKKATRAGTLLRLGIAGPAGSGKSFSGLAIAAEITKLYGGRIAVVDSERGSASLYGGGKPFDFDVVELEDFHPNNYLVAIKSAEQAVDEQGKRIYSVILLDGISQAWEGTEGMLEQKERAAKKAGYNEWSAWRDITPMHNRFVDAMLTSPLHVIATMRVKTEWVVEPNERGKQAPRKIGLAPRFRQGIEHEFGVVGMMDDAHNLEITKTRCITVDGKVYPRPGAEFADILVKWLREGDENAARNILPSSAGLMLTGVQTPGPAEPAPGAPPPTPSNGHDRTLEQAGAAPETPASPPADQGSPIAGDATPLATLSKKDALAKAVEITAGGAKGVLSYHDVKLDVMLFVSGALKACQSEAECKMLAPSIGKLTPDRLATARQWYEARVRETRMEAARAAGAA